MATKLSTVEFLAEQIESAGDVTYRKMFGEYLIYLNAKPVFLICDDTLYVKDLPETAALLADCEKAPPYAGARPHFVVENTDDRAFLCLLAGTLEKVTPFPKKKAKSKG